MNQKPETLKPKPKKPKTIKKPKPEPEEPKIRVKTDKRKLRKLRKDFDELRHKFSKKEIGTEKLFMLLKTKDIFLNQN